MVETSTERQEIQRTSYRQGSIQSRFNLSQAPWWRGQFERLIDLFKQSFYKSIGNRNLTWAELMDVILNIEVTLNSRPLSYLEDDVEQPVLTLTKLLQSNPNDIPEAQPPISMTLAFGKEKVSSEVERVNVVALVKGIRAGSKRTRSAEKRWIRDTCIPTGEGCGHYRKRGEESKFMEVRYSLRVNLRT